MNILIGGGSGFIGSALTAHLRRRGDRVTWISRQRGPGRITWQDIASNGLPPCDAVINLAGRHILDLRRPWTARYRREVIRSRTETTRLLVAAINAAPSPPSVFVSVVGKCFYGTAELAAGVAYPELTEESAPMGMDFPAELVSLWEAAAAGIDAKVRHVRVCLGITLGARGIFPVIRTLFGSGLGAVIGKGSQPFPWVHIDDAVGILARAIDDHAMDGRYNAVAPGIVDNRTFTRTLARVLDRPVLWTLPEWLVGAIVGTERSSILLKGQLVRPRRTLAAGYRFVHPTLEPALEHLTRRSDP